MVFIHRTDEAGTDLPPPRTGLLWSKATFDRFTIRGLIWGSISLAGLVYEIFFRAREVVLIVGYGLVLGISLLYIFTLKDRPK